MDKKIQSAPSRHVIPMARHNATIAGMPSVRPEELAATTEPEPEPTQAQIPCTPALPEVKVSGYVRRPTLVNIAVPPPSDHAGYVPPTPSNGRYCHINPGSDDVVSSRPNRRLRSQVK